MTSPNIKIIEFYAQEKYEPPKAGVPYKPQKFYLDVKLEKAVPIEDVADDIVQRLKASTKNEGIIKKRISGRVKFSFIDYLILGDVSSHEAEDNFLNPYLNTKRNITTLLYIQGSILPSDYYHIEGYPSYETVRILADNLRKEGINEAKEELKPKAPIKSVKERERKKREKR